MNKDDVRLLALYVRCGPGECRIQYDGYVLYDEVRTGHSFSGNLNFWAREGVQYLDVVIAPRERSFDVALPEVELQLVQGDRCDVLIGPDQGKPHSSEVVRAVDQSVKEIIVRYEVNFTAAALGEWLSYPQPWGGAVLPADFGLACDIYKAFENSLRQGATAQLVNLSGVRLGFVAARLQCDKADLKGRFISDMTELGQSSHLFMRCEEPRLQMRFIPVRKDVLYRLERVTGDPPISTYPDETGFQIGMEMMFGRTPDGLCWML